MSRPYQDKFHLQGGELIRQVTFGMNDGVVSIFALLAGLAGAGLSHMNIPNAYFIWHTAIFTTIPCLIYYIMGLYEVYMAYGWDINY